MKFILMLIISFISIVVRPLLTLAFQIFNFIPFIKNRLLFERKNLSDESRPYRSKFDDDVVGNFAAAFFVSSEGEFEQVLPLIQELISEKKKCEIIFTSPSVEKKVLGFYRENALHVSYLRLPLMSFWPFPFLGFQSIWFWVKSPKVVFCRYDFFPELLMFYLFKKKLILVSVTFKNKNVHWGRKVFYRGFFELFEQLIFASETDAQLFKELSIQLGKENDWLGISTKVFDFRVERILKRIENKEVTLFEKANLKDICQKISQLPSHKKMIIGSFWMSDSEALFHPALLELMKNEKLQIFLFPHKLKDNDLREQLMEFLRNRGQVSLVTVASLEELSRLELSSEAKIYYIDIGGILVEMYSYFKLSYVGGGFERSIHSVLEPYMAGNFVLTGPKTHRSTEWELINGEPTFPGGLDVLGHVEVLSFLHSVIQNGAVEVSSSKNYQRLLKWNQQEIEAITRQVF